MRYDTFIFNNTNDTIYFEFDIKQICYQPATYYYPDGKVTCLPKTRTLYKHNQLPHIHPCPYIHPYPYFNNICNPLKITTSSNKTLKKDITNRNNWNCEKPDDDTMIITFIINEEDLE